MSGSITPGSDLSSQRGSGESSLTKQLSRKLSESDVLETQDYSKLLKEQMAILRGRVSEVKKIGERLGKMLSEAERGASLGEADASDNFKTEYSSQLEELHRQVEDLYVQVLEECHIQHELLENAAGLRRRTDTRMAGLFEQVFTAGENVEKQLAAANKRYDIAAQPDLEDVTKKRALQKRLEQIKRNRCILFGCVDVHPEELYRITGTLSPKQ